MFLLDTNICIYIIKNKYPEATNKLLSLSPDDVAISAITVYELEYGAAKSKWGDKVRDKMAAFLAPFRIIPFNIIDAITAGNLRAVLETKGTPIGAYDLLIASQALTNDFTVVTHNISEFARVPGLKCEDWVLIS